MAGNIQNVKLEVLKNECTNYNKLSYALMQEVLGICDDLDNIRKYWTGKRINSIIKIWNDNNIKITQSANYFTQKISSILEEIYEQYQLMEKGTPEDVGFAFAESYRSIPLTDENTIKFDQSYATKLISSITKHNQNISSNLKNLISKLDGMQAYSDSLKTLATNYKNSATEIQKTISTIANNIDTEAKKALNDVKLTEQYNEDDAKRAASTSTK